METHQLPCFLLDESQPRFEKVISKGWFMIEHALDPFLGEYDHGSSALRVIEMGELFVRRMITSIPLPTSSLASFTHFVSLSVIDANEDNTSLGELIALGTQASITPHSRCLLVIRESPIDSDPRISKTGVALKHTWVYPVFRG